MFGTDGDNDAAFYINDSIMTNILHLENVKLLPLGPIKDWAHYLWYYTSKVDILDYNLTINHPGYPYPKRLPYNESFAWPSGCKNIIPEFGNKSMNYNHSFTGVRLSNTSINGSWGLFGGQFTGYFYNVTNCSMVNSQSLLIGNVSYVENVSYLPDDQEGRMFLIDKKDGCEEILENITEFSAVILMDDGSKYRVNQNVINNCSCQIAQVNKNETNLTTVINELKNGTIMIADNYYYNQTISFTYGFDHILAPWWPDHDFFILTWISEQNLSILMANTVAICILNPSVHLAGRGWCHGVIYYGSNANTHEMNGANRYWVGWATDFVNKTLRFIATPGLQMFSVNQSVGQWLAERAANSSNTISGFINQIYYEEVHSGNPNTWTAGVTAYNVEGNITTKNNPTNAIVICSNRYDSMAAQCPGDSGAGAGICLSIAKYMTDNNITPKYNITFLEDTGEEYGFRGAWHYNHSHPPSQYNIIRWIGFDQLGFKHESGPLDLGLRINNQSNSYDKESQILSAIANDSDLGYAVHPEEARPGGAVTEDIAWLTRPNCKTICFEKNNFWRYHHETGMDFTEGDSMKNMNRSELNKTLDFAWLVMKYYTVNPDCWFDNISFTAFDSPNDGDTLNDSIRTNFTIHSILPSDKVRVELDLGCEIEGEQVVLLNAGNAEYLLTSRSQNESYVFTIPDSASDGNYSVSFKLYNSTGRINRIVYGSSGSYHNDTSGASNWYRLYHPLGYTKVGGFSQSVDDRICGSVFTANEDGTADNITAFINQNYMSPGPYKCMLYRESDNALIGTTTSDWVSLPQGNPESSLWWAVFNFTGMKPQLVKGTDYVITCWGDSAFSYVYYNESESNTTGRYDTQEYGTPPDPADFTNEPRYYSLYCSYTPDTTPPQIINVNASPYTVGFGYNVTITANITDDLSGVDSVKVQIDYPGGKSGNFTMTHISNDTYQYLFTDTWLTGQYNYTIWVVDCANNSNSSGGHQFHIAAKATISIATLQDNYTGNEYINITDPPNPPENYTLVDRGLTWDKYYDTTTGQNILEISTGPINYPEENGKWTPINNSFNQLTSDHPAYVYGYRTGNDHGLFGAYFKSYAQNDWPVAFTYNQSDDPTIHAVRSKLVGVGYVDPQSNWAYQYLQSVQNSQGQTNDYSITYPGVFTGTDATWSYGNTGLKEEIILSNTTKMVLQNHPPSQYGLNDASSYLVFITKLDYQNLNLYNGSGVLDGNVTISDSGIDFKDALGDFKCALPLGEAYELNNESVRQKLIYRIVHLNGNTYLLSGLKLSDLTVMTFPVVIDPTITVCSSTSDGYLSQSSTISYNAAWTSATGAVTDSADGIIIGQVYGLSIPYGYSYIIRRGFLFFNTSVLPENACLLDATVSLYKKTDASTVDFDIVIQNGQPISPHDPLQTNDYNKNLYAGDGGSMNTGDFVNGRNNFTFMNLSWINQTGVTKLCLRSSRDIQGTAPTGTEYVAVYSREKIGFIDYSPHLVITYQNQSKIKNTGSTDIKGYLLIQVQYYNEILECWVVDDDTVNETIPRAINSGSQLALDIIFNGHVRASGLTHGEGTYRVYAAFRDPEGNILRTDDDIELVSWWEFTKT
jgi:hypothetical protein